MATKKRAAVRAAAAPTKAKKKKPPPPNPNGRPKPAPLKAYAFRASTVAKALPELADPEIPTPDKASHTYLRFAAMLHYTTSLNGTSIDEMLRHPLFSSLSRNTITKWSMQDKWVDRRKEVMAQWQHTIEERIGDALVRARMKSIGRIEAVREKLLKKLEGVKDHEFVEGEPYYSPSEKLIGYRCAQCNKTEAQHDPFLGVPGDRAVVALAKLMELEFALAEVVLRYTTAATDGQAKLAGSSPTKVTLTTDEAKGAVKAILAQRRAALKEKGSGDASDDA